LATARAELDGVESLLRSSRAITDQPDWSALLGLLSTKAGNDVFLRSCGVRPRDPAAYAAPVKPAGPPARPAAGGKPPPPPDPTVLVALAGLGASQASVSQFALRLEATGLFDRVRLLETSREVAVGLQLVSFRIECTLAEPGKPAEPGRPHPRRPAASAAPATGGGGGTGGGKQVAGGEP
jgi:hypothetical protein